MIIVYQSLGSRPIQVLDLFTPVPRLFGTTSRCLSVQPFQLLPLKNIWRHISLIWRFPHRYRHSPWPVDVTELFPRLCCWTLIWLSRHWAWLRRGCWRYKSLIDWLIDWWLSDGPTNEHITCHSLTLIDRHSVYHSVHDTACTAMYMTQHVLYRTCTPYCFVGRLCRELMNSHHEYD